MSFYVCTLACGYQDSNIVTKRMLELNPKAVYLLGDAPAYYAKTWTYFGTTAQGVLYNSTQAQFEAHVTNFMSFNGMRELSAYRAATGCKVYWHPDDHGWGGDNWDHTINRAQQNDPIGGSASAGAGPPTAEEVLTHWRTGTAAHAASIATYYDNPAFGAAGNGDIPQAAQATSGVVAADFPVRYFSTDFDQNGNVGGTYIRIPMLDCLSYKHDYNFSPSTDRTLLGLTQRAWLLDQVETARVAGYKHTIIMSTKDLFNIDNADGWRNYTTERDLILSTFQSTDASVGWMSGDRHTPHAGIARIGRGDAYDAVCVCPTGCGVPLSAMTAYPQNVWQTLTNNIYVFGAVFIDDVNLQAVYSIRDIYSGDVLYSITIPFGRRIPAGLS